MATTFREYNAPATYSFTFPSYQSSDVQVRVDGVLKTAGTHYNITGYSTTGGGTVAFIDNSGSGGTNHTPSSGVVRIYRDTNVEVAKATYTAGSSVKAADLNNNTTQLLYRAQEEQIPNLIHSWDIDDGAVITTKIENDAITSDKIADDQINSEHYVAGSIDLEHMSANSVDSDQYVDGSVDRVHLEADIIDSTKLADNAVNSEHYVDLSIDTEHIANENVTTAKLAPDAVTSAKLADNAVNSEHYVDGSVDHIHLANDAVDGDNIADDSINSEHYVDGSIDTAHIAADQITNALIADNQIDSEHYVDGSVDHVHLANDCIDGDNIQDDVVNSEHIVAGALDNEHYAAGSITSDKLNGATVVTASEQAAAASNDTSFLTTAAADARFFNVSTGDTIKDGDTFPDNDTTIATTAAINDRIIDLVDDVGGFVPIANETSFPTSNPDVNDGAGTIVSVSAASTNLAPSGTTVTIANGRGSGLAVIITGVSATIPSGFGFLVETTTTDHTYTFHRLVPKATEVTTVAGKATEIGRLGTAAAVEDMSILGTTDVVADLNTLGTADVVSDMNALAVSDVISDMNTLAVTSVINDMDTVAGISSNVTTVAGISANVTTVAGISSNVTTVANANSNVTTVANANSNISAVAGSIANVNTTASNIANVNNFADRYQVASSDPPTDGGGNALAEGDLYFNTNADELKVYNGGAWQGGVTASGNFATKTGNTFTGSNIHNDNVKSIYGTSSDGLEIFHNASDSVINDQGTGSLKLQTGGNTKIEVTSTGTSVTGNIVVSGNVDGRDVAADGVKIDGLTSSSGVLSNGVVATTQAASDNTTKVATTAYTTTAIANINTDKIEEGNSKVEVVDAGTGYVTTEVDGTEQIRTIPNQTTIKYLRVGEAWTMADNTGTGLSLQTSNLNDVITSTANNGFQIRGASIALTQTGSPNNNYAVFSNTGCDLRVANVQKLVINSSGTTLHNDLLSGTDSTHDIGTTSNRFANIYADTFTGALTGNVTGNVSGSSGSCTGNAATATALANARTIAGVSFDGTGNISLNNNAITNGAGYITSSGNAATATKLAATKTIAGVAFDGSANISLNNNAITNGAGYITAQLGSNLDVNGYNIVFGDSSSAGTNLNRLKFGAGNDFNIYHDSNNSIIQNFTGQLKLKASTSGTSVQLVDHNGNAMVQAVAGGVVSLIHNNSTRFQTDSNGCTVFGDRMQHGDNTKAQFGNGGDLQIYHDGSDSYIKDTGTGDLKIYTNNFDLRNAAGNATLIDAHENGAVELYHANSKKLETTSSGIKSQGTGQVNLIAGSTNAGGSYLILDGDSNGDAAGSDYASVGHTTSGSLDIRNMKNSSINFATNNSNRWIIYDSGKLVPSADSTYDIGTSAIRPANIYADTLHGDGSNLTNLPGGGKILQVIHGSLDGSFGTGSGSYQATGCSASITMSGNNKVYVMAGGTVNNTSAGEGGKMTVYRGSSNIATHGNDIAGYWQEDNSNNVEQSVFLSALDTPGTGTHTYQVYIHAHGGTFYWGYRNTGVITIMEVEA